MHFKTLQREKQRQTIPNQKILAKTTTTKTGGVRVPLKSQIERLGFEGFHTVA